MTAATKPAGRKLKCAGCKKTFIDSRRSGAPRSFCFDCRPPAGQPRAAPKRPRLRKLPGAPLSAEHFAAWTRRLRLKGGKRFVMDGFEERFAADVLAGLRGDVPQKEFWLIVPEGNGKSTFVAVLILYILEFVPEAAIPIAASARGQAEIIFDQGQGFGRRTPALEGRFRFKPGLREIVFEEEASEAKIFASDDGTGDGIIPFPLEVLDELHRHVTLDLYRTWAGKLDKEDAILVVISTAGEPGSDFEETRKGMRAGAEKAEREGRCFARFEGKTFVLHEYAVPEGGDVFDLELVKEANPSRRVTRASLEAKMARPSWSLSHWQRLTCNIPTRDVNVAIGEREWEAARCADPIPAGEPVGCGLDLGWKIDTTAWVPLWVPSEEHRQFGPAEILIPPRDGSLLDVELVQDAFLRIHERNPVELVVMDMSNGATIANWLDKEFDIRVVDRTQSAAMAALGYSRWMDAMSRGFLKHSGDAGLSKHVLNAVAKPLGEGAAKFARPAESRRGSAAQHAARVIDALTAAEMIHTTYAAEFYEEAEESGSLPPMVRVA